MLGEMGLAVCALLDSRGNYVRNLPRLRVDVSANLATMDRHVQTPPRGHFARARWVSPDRSVDGPSTTVSLSRARMVECVTQVSMGHTSASVLQATLAPTAPWRFLPATFFRVKMAGDVSTVTTVAIRVSVLAGSQGIIARLL